MSKIECPHGHIYEYMEVPKWWPPGAPICPLCCKSYIYMHPTWSYVKKLQEMAKIKRRILELYGRKEKERDSG
jgi:hypothetical protein